MDDGRIRFGFGSELTTSALLVPRRLHPVDELAGRNWETLDESELPDFYVSARLWVSMLRIEEPA
ncbi:MAG TPA: hypothetical protein VGK85_02040, partial [Myxococcaceae bacterium]